jgi:hypothetical protein
MNDRSTDRRSLVASRHERLDQDLFDQLGNLQALAERNPESAAAVAKWTAELIPERTIAPETIRRHANHGRN